MCRWCGGGGGSLDEGGGEEEVRGSFSIIVCGAPSVDDVMDHGHRIDSCNEFLWGQAERYSFPDLANREPFGASELRAFSFPIGGAG